MTNCDLLGQYQVNRQCSMGIKQSDYFGVEQLKVYDHMTQTNRMIAWIVSSRTSQRNRH
jgi:hypothetical protein